MESAKQSTLVTQNQTSIKYINEHIQSVFYGIDIQSITMNSDALRAGYHVKALLRLADDEIWKINFLAPFFQIEKSRGHYYLEDALVLLLFGSITREIELRKPTHAGLLREMPSE